MPDGISLEFLLLLPIGLGLLGFVEPCTVAAHLVFLGTQQGRRFSEKGRAFTAFILARTVVTGAFGAGIAWIGEAMIDAQTGFWLGFGAFYIVLGSVFLAGKGSFIKIQFKLAPAALRRATNPVVLGATFGLNIPACAAPILFGLMAMTAAIGTALNGFLTMAVFGLALSAPLALFLFVPRFVRALHTVGRLLERRSWVLAVTFLILGLWSVWFGLFVEPVNWSQL